MKGDEFVIIFCGLLCLVCWYFVVFDFDFKYWYEFLRIWVVFFLMILKLIIDCLKGYYSGVLFVGDLLVNEVMFCGKIKSIGWLLFVL